MREVIIASDIGWGNLNSFDGKGDFICPATFGVGIDKLDNSGYQVIYNNEKYLIGDKTLSYSRGIKKELLQNKLMMYLTVFNYVDDGDHVKLVVSCPVDVYLNRESRLSFKKFLWEKKEVNLTVDNISKTFHIDKLEIVAEGSGVMYTAPERFSDKTVGIIDIGAGTINFLYTHDLNIIREQTFSEVIGIHELRTQARDELKKNGIIINMIEVDEVLKSKRYRDITDEVLKRYIERMAKIIKEHSWSQHVPLLFTGGGSLLLKDKLVDYFPNSTVSTSPLVDNVHGNYQIGVLLWSGK
ncbi:MAG: ParM/StbA family protein [Turicibacter sp.]|nr:ParM/StbA family protein [Turicibacter sp.]